MANDLTHFQQQQAPAQANVRPSKRFKFDLMDPDSLNHIWRVAGMYAASALFPKHLRGKNTEEARANAVMVMNIADRLNEDALTVANHVYFVGNNAGWAASYMINRANQYGIFKNPIDWEIEGEGDNLEVTAYAEMAGTGKIVRKKITFKQAKEEGWTSNKKYQTMPETMLQYRSATALIRLYCPEVMQGMPVVEEGDEANNSKKMRDVTPDAPTDFEKAFPEAAAETARPKVDRTPPPAAQKEEAEGEDAEEEEAAPDPEATRIYGQNDGLHARRTKVQIEMDREIEDLAASLDIDVPTERPAVVVVEELRARAEAEATQEESPEQAPQEDQTEGEPASEATGDPDAMMRAIDAAFTEDDLKMAAVGAGDLPEADRTRVREHYAKRLLQIREQTSEEGSDDFQPDYGKLADLICRDLEQVSGDAVHEVLSTYETHLEDLEQKDTSAYQRVMNLAETRAGI